MTIDENLNQTDALLESCLSDEIEARYDRAQNLMQGIFTRTVVFNTVIFPNWIGCSDCFWYQRESRNGRQYRLVNAKAATNEIAFDHNVFAAKLAELATQEVDANNLPIQNVCIELNPLVINFTAFNRHWVYDSKTGSCKEKVTGPEDCVVSPNGKQGIFIREFNLWVRDLENGREEALTQDGEENYIYGIGAACIAPIDYNNVQVRWSADSARIFAVQRDTRQLMSSYSMHHVPQDGSLRPQLVERKDAYPGDDHVETLRLLAIDVKTGRIQAANYRHIPVTRSGLPFFTSSLGWWAKDSRRAYFVDVERDYKTVRVVEFDTHTGETNMVFEEASKTHISLMLNADESPVLVPLPETEELLWFSERTGWAHLYLYDLETGELKNTVSQGEWLIRDVIRIDHKRREVYVQTAGRSNDRDPYYRDLCRIHLDTSEITPLISSDHEYWAITQKNQGTMAAKGLGLDASSACGVSSNGNFAVVTRSRADEVPVTLLLDRDGRVILELETADITALPNGWHWPEPVKLVAADGETAIYGLVFRPSNFSPDRTYPVISNVYNTPDLTRVSKGSFNNGIGFGYPYLNAAALAELGFIVVQIDGRGTPFRCKAFHDESYGCTQSASNLNDHVAGIQQLAKRYPYMDLDRVGVSSHPSGGVGVVNGLLQHPNFYKVGVAMNPYDCRLIGAGLWGEKYEGAPDTGAGGRYPEELVDKLQGKLLLINTMVDMIAPPAGVLRIVEALQTANKDFDLLLLPNSSSSYLIRRSWDYLVRHLLDVKPPENFKLTTFFDNLGA